MFDLSGARNAGRNFNKCSTLFNSDPLFVCCFFFFWLGLCGRDESSGEGEGDGRGGKTLGDVDDREAKNKKTKENKNKKFHLGSPAFKHSSITVFAWRSAAICCFSLGAHCVGHLQSRSES